MKKHNILCSGVAAIASLMLCVGCGGGSSTQPKEVVLKAAQTAIKGDLKGCYEVVDKNYRVKFATESWENDVVTVELKRTETALPYDRKNVVIFPEADESSAEYCAGFGCEVLDADGNVLDKITANATPYSWDEMTAALQLLPDETTTIDFHFDDLSEAASFRITSLVQPNEERKITLGTEIDAVMDIAEQAAKLSDEVDIDEVQADAEKALEMAGKSMELASDMLNMLGN